MCFSPSNDRISILRYNSTPSLKIWNKCFTLRLVLHPVRCQPSPCSPSNFAEPTAFQNMDKQCSSESLLGLVAW